jgi:hypothetical protein
MDSNPFAQLIPPEPVAAPVAPEKPAYVPRTQAERVIAKFGGARKLCRALERLDATKHRDASCIFRWRYPKSKGGTDGLVPTAALADVVEAARLEGILLSSDDLDPRRK